MLSAAHFLTHVGLSWLIASLAPLSRKDRVLVVLAGVLLDLDGAGILWSERAYLAFHRAAGHGALAALVLVAVAVLCADSPWLTGPLAALAFHVHLLLDVVGTGGAPIEYFWPFSDWRWSWSGHWVLGSWQDTLVMGMTFLGVLLVAWRRSRNRSPGAAGATIED